MAVDGQVRVDSLVRTRFDLFVGIGCIAAFRVLAHWVEEARVWWAESVDIKGVVAEADTLEGLVDEAKGDCSRLITTQSWDVIRNRRNSIAC
jgi:hypothetical protein